MTILAIISTLAVILSTVLELSKLASLGPSAIHSFLGKEVSALELSDEDFRFLQDIAHIIGKRQYLPSSASELQRCISLLNCGVLYQARSKTYKITRRNRGLLSNFSAQ